MRKTITAVSVAIGSFLAMAATAVAQTTTTAPIMDQVGTQVNSGVSDTSNFVFTYALPAIFALLLLGIAIRLGVKFLRRATAKV